MTKHREHFEDLITGVTNTSRTVNAMTLLIQMNEMEPVLKLGNFILV